MLNRRNWQAWEAHVAGADAKEAEGVVKLWCQARFGPVHVACQTIDEKPTFGPCSMREVVPF
jgi:hypothetical protein